MYDTLGPNGEVYEPVIRSTPNFNPEADAESIEKAMKGAGTDEKAIIKILCKRTADERGQIAKTYKSLFGKDLIKQIKSETSGDFGKMMRYLCLDRATLKAKIIYDCIEGLGTDELGLIEIICSATNKEIAEIKEAYKKVLEFKGKDSNRRNLEKDIGGDCSGFLKRVLVALVQAERNEPTPEQYQQAMTNGVDCLINMAAARQAAEKLYNAGEGKLGTDESVFIRYISHESVWQLAAIDQCYSQLSKKTLRDAVKSEMSGDLCTALKSTLDFCLNRPATFAVHLHKAMAGLGTRESTLTRIITTRMDVDLGEIKKCYQQQYGKSLGEAIKSDTSGDYRTALLTAIGEL